MNEQLRRERPPWGWRELGAALTVVVVGISAAGLLWLGDTLSREGLGPQAPAEAEQPQKE